MHLHLHLHLHLHHGERIALDALHWTRRVGRVVLDASHWTYQHPAYRITLEIG